MLPDDIVKDLNEIMTEVDEATIYVLKCENMEATNKLSSVSSKLSWLAAMVDGGIK